MRILAFMALMATASVVAAQKLPDKVFWKETFSEGNLPKGWKAVALNDSSISWFVTDQPFPGSYGRNYQAPPIASNSRGYHLQFAPAVKVDKRYRKWKKEGKYPNAYVQSDAIDCSKKKSVVLKFQQNFYWNDRDMDKDAGLFVGVSNNGKDWTEYDVRNNVPAGEDCLNPMNVEINITRTAANQKNVYLRFSWRGLYHWYWMVDDVELTEAFDADILAYNLDSHKETGNKFGANDQLVFKVVNLGSQSITNSFDCQLFVDNREPIKVTVPASKKKPIGIIDTVAVRFPNLNLADIGLHKVKFVAQLPGDMRTSNDTISKILYSGAYELGKVTRFEQRNDFFELACNRAKVRLQFPRSDIFRVMMAYDGEFTDPAGKDIVINLPEKAAAVAHSDQGDYYLFKTDKLALRAYKNPLRLALYRADNATLVWEEQRGMTYGQQTVQYLRRGTTEYYYGGGMQNGRFSHRDKTIKMNIDYNWEDGGNPNPAPFFMSTAGWGALRNTYAPGEYTFGDTVKLSHEEPRFDSYFFVGTTLKDILNSYTDITGKPFLMPRWGLSMGDANCYNRGAKSGKTVGSTSTGHSGLTPSVIDIIADKYIEHNMPRGWILPNDGYGCGYTRLDSVVTELHKRGFYTGLWTESGVEKIAREVGQYGSRLCKLDVAWVGPGYKFALDGAKAAYEGIEKNSNARGFVWMVCGWAGSHRNAVLWTGDQSGTWDYIRWHIPTVIGSGLSAQNCATGDIDGIFGGSDSTFTRDLQWKCFTPAFMSMSGWASNNKNGVVDKQPWLFGEPFTSINRKYLMLKQRLTPYMYTHCAEANKTGVPAVRALVLEYPNDPNTWGEETTRYEFLLGKDILVAPVFKSEDKRDGIYLPQGTWIDFWDGKPYSGGTTLNGYAAPLDKLPLFVRSGAIIPMYQQMMFDAQRPADTLTLRIFPNGASSYNLYEDDGLTRDHRVGKFATTKFDAVAGSSSSLDVTVNPVVGTYNGMYAARAYILEVVTAATPKQVAVNGKKLAKVRTLADFERCNEGWFYDTCFMGGAVRVKTAKVSTAATTAISLK
ncbi:TIM-barrel domain-containing protein [Alistipes sp. ZOR0009]|uniref:glycoside hydrolase family 31 protein n=1 Tax=Alistipes sp. ZOR0009 TaxID=1339253 RepID=UPI00068C31D6|nr:TIM-barrel domain-containing protein [Alistipes sp. ZOR0009]